MIGAGDPMVPPMVRPTVPPHVNPTATRTQFSALLGKPGHPPPSTVTQPTSKSTGVTMNTMSGQIPMHGAVLAPGGTVSFVVTNTKIQQSDILALNHIAGGTAGAYTLNARAADGSATIDVRNVSGGP